jgi:hypothetical protein
MGEMVEATWWKPVKAALLLIPCASAFGMMVNIKLVIVAVGLARLETGSPLISSPAIWAKKQLEQREQCSPLARRIVNASPAQLIAGTHWGRDLDRHTLAEYHTLVFFGFLSVLFLNFAVSCISVVFLDRRKLVALLSRFREHQLRNRPQGSKYPQAAEYLLYLVSWEEYDCVADVAKVLRGLYETDWEPRAGRFLADCWYTYEVFRALPRLHETTRQLFERRSSA